MMLERRCRNPHLAEDLAQDSLFIVLEKLRKGVIEDPAKLGGFLHSTAKNCFANWQRKEWRHATTSDTDQVESVSGNRQDPFRQLVRQESKTLVRRLVNSLKKERDRDVLHRFYVLDQEKTQVCAALDLSPADFDRIISRARARMRQLITHRLGADNLGPDWITNWEEST